MSDWVSSEKITINGISSDTVGIWVDYLEFPPMAEPRYSENSVGADMDLVCADDDFENIEYTVNFHTFNGRYNNSDIYAFLQSANTLTISTLPDFYFKVRKVSGIRPTQYKGNRADYTVTFTLAPFKYKVANSEITVSGEETMVENTGTRYSKPTITANVTGEATIAVNGVEFGISTNESTNITIDCERLITYDGSGNLLVNATSGLYPMLPVGQNIIALSGNIDNVKLLKNERCY